jgi:hypothetical protein
VKTPLRRLIAGLTLTLATATGYAITDQLAAAPADTAWGAPDTTDAPPVVTEPFDTSAVTVTPLDTAWG